MSSMMAEPMKVEYSAEPMKIQFPVAKTFIQYPALRNPSLEAFFQEREISSCPASRMPSIDEEDILPSSNTDNSLDISSSLDISTIAKEIDPPPGLEYTVKNTFIDHPSWESLRNPSLEGFFQERQLKSCPVSRAQTLDDTQDCGTHEFSIADIPTLSNISLEECLRDIETKHQDPENSDEISTKANTEEDTAPPTPQILSDSEEDTRPRAISLTNSLGLWSVGSAQHNLGTCKPCAWLWKNENGCENGANCNFCHMCPPGEVKRRKKDKLAMRKMVKQFQKPQAQALQGVAYYGMLC
jgi:hypothetical protein